MAFKVVYALQDAVRAVGPHAEVASGTEPAADGLDDGLDETSASDAIKTLDSYHETALVSDETGVHNVVVVRDDSAKAMPTKENSFFRKGQMPKQTVVGL